MIRAEPTLTKSGGDAWFGQYRTGRFWHTVRAESGEAVHFQTEAEAEQAARDEWWATVKQSRRIQPCRAIHA